MSESLRHRFEDFSEHTIKILVGFIFIGTILRFLDLSEESFWLDEILSLDFSSHSARGIIQISTSREVHPPLYFILLHHWMEAFGNSEWAVRALSALFGVLTLPLFYLLGKKLFDRNTGLLVSLFSAISVFQIQYAQEARPYSLLLLLSLLSYLLFVHLLERYDRFIWFGYCVSSILLLYTHVYGSLIFSTQIIYFLITASWKTGSYRRILPAFGCVFVFILPMIYFGSSRVQRLSSHGFWLQRPELKTLFKTFVSFSGSQVLLAIFVGLAVVGFLRMRDRNGKGTLQASGRHFLLLLWLSVPVIVPFLWSQFALPIYHTRYLIGALPPFFLLFASGVASLGSRAAMYVCVCVIALFSISSLHAFYVYDFNEQWRKAGQLVTKEGVPETDGAIISDSMLELPFRHYYQGRLKTHDIRKSISDVQTISKVVDNAIRGKQRLWVILASRAQYGPVLPYVESRFGPESKVFHKIFAGNVNVILFRIPPAE